MNMVILKAGQLRIFYENDANFFSRRRTEMKIGAFERKMFEVFEKKFWGILKFFQLLCEPQKKSYQLHFFTSKKAKIDQNGLF